VEDFTQRTEETLKQTLINYIDLELYPRVKEPKLAKQKNIAMGGNLTN
jgi:hypothetical protein